MTHAEALAIGPHGLCSRLDAARAALSEDHPFSGARYDRRLALVRELESGLSLLGWAHPVRVSS